MLIGLILDAMQMILMVCLISIVICWSTISLSVFMSLTTATIIFVVASSSMFAYWIMALTKPKFSSYISHLITVPTFDVLAVRFSLWQLLRGESVRNTNGKNKFQRFIACSFNFWWLTTLHIRLQGNKNWAAVHFLLLICHCCDKPLFWYSKSEKNALLVMFGHYSVQPGKIEEHFY